MLVVGTNLTQDRIIRLADLLPGAVLRAREVVTAPGGKPVNVARAALALGGRPTLLASCPGHLGALLAEQLVADGLEVTAVHTAGELRTATILLEDGGRTTVVNEPGPVLDGDGVAALLSAYDGALAAQQRTVVVVSGSLPPGAPVDLYAELVRRGAQHGCATVVDVGGPVLAAALPAGPTLVKPNLAEAEAVLRLMAGAAADEAGTDHAEAVDESGQDVPGRCLAAAVALAEAGAKAALVSGGRTGAALHSPAGSWWVAAPVVDTVNPVGAGDTLVAGVAVALGRGDPLPAAVRFGVACAADSVRRVGPGAVEPAAVAALLDSVQISTRAEMTT